jgi:hypothetical protein
VFTLSTSMLTSPTRDKVVAHELAHYILGHEPRRLSNLTRQEWQSTVELWELDANAKAVEILTRAKPMSEELALSLFYDHMISAHRGVVAGRSVVPFGHRPPCEEIADLLGRFPHHATWTSPLECAKTAPAARPTIRSSSPSRLGTRSDLVTWAYLADRSPANGATLASNADLPRRIVDFDRSRHRWIVLFLAVKADRPTPLSVTWTDGGGRVVATDQVLSGKGPDVAWEAHAIPMWRLRPYPGRWTARLLVDGQPAGDYPFLVQP